jgi:hypothetical protein
MADLREWGYGHIAYPRERDMSRACKRVNLKPRRRIYRVFFLGPGRGWSWLNRASERASADQDLAG